MNRLRRTLLLLFGGWVLLYTALYIIQIPYYRSRIPEIIETRWWPVTMYGDTLGSCGASVFRLTKKTREAIKSQGTAFFEDALITFALNPFLSRQEKNHYEWWKETPVPEGIFSNGFGLGCETSFSKSEQKEIRKAALSEGSYYTKPSESGWLLVLTDLSLVMYIYHE